MKIVLTAGFDKSLPALLIADRLLADGHEICGIVVASPYSLKRIRALLLSRGFSGIKTAVGKLLKGVENNGSNPNPLQTMKEEQNLTINSLKRWCAKKGITHHLANNINDTDTVQFITDTQPNLLVYGGGGILRAPIINSVSGYVLNAHAGPLPEVRGMNAIEWATLLNERQSISLHFIDIGIDTGRLICEAPVPTSAGDNINTLRSRAIATGVHTVSATLKGLESPTQLVTNKNIGKAAGRQCYPLSQALSELLDFKLKMQ